MRFLKTGFDFDRLSDVIRVISWNLEYGFCFRVRLWNQFFTVKPEREMILVFFCVACVNVDHRR